MKLHATSVDLRPLMTPAKHQGARGTCSAFAAVSLAEFLIKQHIKRDIDLSEAYTYWATKEYTLSTDYIRSMYERVDGNAGFMAVESLKYGVVHESNWRYENYNWLQMNNGQCDPQNVTTECFTGLPPANLHHLPYAIEPIFIPVEKIPHFLLTKRKPVVINVFWYMKSFDQHGNFFMPTPEIKRAGGGGHVIILVGYDSKTDRYIFKNSYGRAFGQNGFGTMPREYLETYLEVKPYLQSMDQYSYEVQDFLRKSSMGVSGNLIVL